MLLKRCRCKTHRGTMCKNKINTFMNMCSIHYRQYYNKNAIIIQHSWDTFRCRKISKYFLVMPSDLQSKIVWYIQESDLIKKYHHEIIVKIIHNKIDSSIISSSVIPEYPIWNDIIPDIRKLCVLCVKYNSIIPLNNQADFMNRIYKFLYDIRINAHDFESVRTITDILYKLWKIFSINLDFVF